MTDWGWVSYWGLVVLAVAALVGAVTAAVWAVPELRREWRDLVRAARYRPRHRERDEVSQC